MSETQQVQRDEWHVFSLMCTNLCWSCRLHNVEDETAETREGKVKGIGKEIRKTFRKRKTRRKRSGRERSNSYSEGSQCSCSY